MIKTINNGVIRINELSFLQFSNCFRGFLIVSKKTGRSIPKFLIYWNGISVAEAKTRFSLERRKNDD
jgi:hypothetical protein